MLHEECAYPRITDGTEASDCLKEQIQSQTITICALKALLDQCRNEIDRLRHHQSTEVSIRENNEHRRYDELRDDLILQVRPGR